MPFPAVSHWRQYVFSCASVLPSVHVWWCLLEWYLTNACRNFAKFTTLVHMGTTNELITFWDEKTEGQGHSYFFGFFDGFPLKAHLVRCTHKSYVFTLHCVSCEISHLIKNYSVPGLHRTGPAWQSVNQQNMIKSLGQPELKYMFNNAS